MDSNFVSNVIMAGMAYTITDKMLNKKKKKCKLKKVSQL
jgi:hypothetical protein